MVRVGLDTAIFIYLLEENPQYLKAAEDILHQVESGKALATFSCIGMIELLTGPKKLERYELAAQYRELLSHFPNLTIVGINENVIEIASDLRASYKIPVPDCIHLASAIDFRAEKFITTDKALKKVKEIKVELL